MDSAKAFNERLKGLRIQFGVTQKAIAEGIGVAPVSLQRFEYGTVKPKLDTVIRLADYFNVSTDYLLGRTDVPEVNRKPLDAKGA